MNETTEELAKEMTRDFARIWKEYTDPLEIRKRLNKQKRDKIKGDKMSDYCLDVK